MSSKSSIFYTNNGTHIYSETNEWDDVRKGFNIYFAAFWREYEDVHVCYNRQDVDEIIIKTRTGKEYRIATDDTFEWSCDDEGFYIGICPNTKAAELVSKIKDL